MLKFYVEPKPHDYIRDGMTDDAIPAGNFYLQSFDMVPLSSSPQRFVLETSTKAPVKIYVGNRLVWTHLPHSERDVIELPVIGTNDIFVTNGIDAPVSLTIVATYITTLMDALAEQQYEVAGRINERYLALTTSPWASFFVDWLLPFSRQLPDVRSMRIIALKAVANALFGLSGSDGAVKAVVSAFSSSTPVVHRSHNPTTWQPELYQPYTSGDDMFGWDFHVWIPNLCINRWTALIGYIANNDKWDFVRFDENVVMLRQHDTEYYQQHVFDNTGKGCSFLDMISRLGCMDRLVFSGSMSLSSQPSFCFWAHSFDSSVEYPGIGGTFFDSGEEFDGGWVEFDNIYDIDLKTDYWVGTSLSTTFDGGHCFDIATTSVVLPQNQDCCYEGPDTKILTTMRCDATVVSPVKPNHPLYGGDDPGYLPDPYFGILG
jgi:hypothetical protein